MHRTHHRATLAITLALALVGATACSSDDDDATTTTAAAPTTVPTTDAPTTVASTEAPATTTASTSGAGGDGVTMEGISTERCNENKAAGKITYLSSFDFAAAASILDVVVAKDQGYFDMLCLDVDIKSGFSTSNYPLVASGEAQFSSAGSYTEILNFSVDGASFVALADYGKTPIEALVVKDPAVTDLADLEGATIGVKGDIPPSLVAMLSSAGLTRGEDYEEVLVDGFDPTVHLAGPIDALPVYKSNEPATLDAADVDYALFDPTELGIPGSFGLLYTSTDFAAEHPTVAEDFIRAALKGMEFSLADPDAAVDIAVKQIDAAGNAFFLTKEGESFRWQQELAEVQKGTPSGQPVGVIDPAVFENEIAAYTEAGVFESAPSMDGTYDADLAAGLYDADGTLIFPGG